MNIQKFWEVTLKQDAKAMRLFLHQDAYVNWHNTNEHFTVDEFIRANCEYPGQWCGDIERLEVLGNLYITAVHVYSNTKALSFHVTSFIKVNEELITGIDEYWGDDGVAPEWRLDKHIGTTIHE